MYTYAHVVEISFNWVLTRSGRVFVKLGGVVKESRLCNKTQKVPFTTTIQMLIRADISCVTAIQLYLSTCINKKKKFNKYFMVSIKKDLTFFIQYYMYCCTKTLHFKNTEIPNSKSNKLHSFFRDIPLYIMSFRSHFSHIISMRATESQNNISLLPPPANSPLFPFFSLVSLPSSLFLLHQLEKLSSSSPNQVLLAGSSSISQGSMGTRWTVCQSSLKSLRHNKYIQQVEQLGLCPPSCILPMVTGWTACQCFPKTQ